MAFIKTILFGLLCSWISMRVYLMLVKIGFGVDPLNQYPGNCSVIAGIDCGSEDIAITQDGLAFISSGLRQFTKCPGYFGKIYTFDINKPELKPFEMPIESTTLESVDFEPHGISLYDLEGLITLYVVNHGKERETIEVFVYDQLKRILVHKDTLSHTSFVCLNSVVAVAPGELYITNWLRYCPSGSHAFSAIELMLHLRSGNVVHYNNGEVEIVASSLIGPNGIATSPDFSQIFVAAMGQHQILIYDRTHAGLELNQAVDVKLEVDNLFVDQQHGDIYGAAFTKGYSLMMGEYNDTIQYPPSQALRLKKLANGAFDVQQVLYSDGKDFVRGATVYAVYKKTALVGTLWHKFGICML